jgi:hypothetical protein
MSYGPNFEFRVPPRGGQRAGRYSNGAAVIPIGAPVAVDTTADPDTLGLQPTELVTAGVAPVNGTHGIAVFEHIEYRGDDPVLTDYTEKSTIAVGAAIQLVSGDEVKVVLRNTEDETFLNGRDYTGRAMIAGLGATVSLAVGDLLTPGGGDDTQGYWVETATADEAWLVVTKVDNDRGEVEARLAF